ncbi:hypothetical protein [Silvibacterium acidisoli]|uniref:hypothetical protein n=1 Tax=Acidobacteriaceae bacterium ZG23-2 TaxID=2883246 RepID=UPI00406CC8FF
MLRCANASCAREQLYLRNGRLYLVDRPNRFTSGQDRQVIWLCEDCCNCFQVDGWRKPGEQMKNMNAMSSEPAVTSWRYLEAS